MAESRMIVVGVRLTQAEKEKLRNLCAHTQREQGDLLRTLIRLAEPVDIPAVRFVDPSVGKEACVV
jgi:hypothetical protein